MKVIRMDQTEAEPLEVSDQLAGTPFRPYVIRDAVVYHRAKTRAGTHHTKGRSDVSGSTRKLFKQKGTGNARQGSIRAPHRRHGGVVFGPLYRSHAIGMNKKSRKLALASVIAEKIRKNSLMVVDSLEPKTHKTKELAQWLKKLELNKLLIVVEDVNENLVLASANLPGVELIHFTQLNVYNLLRYPKALFTRGAVSRIQERLVG